MEENANTQPPTVEQVVLEQQQRINLQESVLLKLSDRIDQLVQLVSVLSAVSTPAPPAPAPAPVIPAPTVDSVVTRPKPKISLPEKFSGDPDKGRAWLSAMETYLAYYELLDTEDGSAIISSLLQGDAFMWYLDARKNFHTARQFLHWLKEFVDPPSNDRKYREKLKRVAMGAGTVAKYVSKFRSACLYVPDLSPRDKFERFLDGLQPDIRTQVLLHTNGPDYDSAIRVALNFDALTNSNFSGGYRHHDQFKQKKQAPLDGAPMDLDQVEQQNKFRPMTDSQRKYLTANHGCFYCRKANAGHRAAECPVKLSRRGVNEVEVDLMDDEGGFDEIDGADDLSTGSSASDRFIKSNLGLRQTLTNSKEVLINHLSSYAVESPVLSLDTKLHRQFSSISDRDDWLLNRRVANDLFERWGTPTIDLFAGKANTQAPYYFRKPSDRPYAEGCIGEDALKASWDFQELVYCNPPWKLAKKVIQKIKRDQTPRVILILPFTNKTLRDMSISTPVKLAHSEDLFIPASRQADGDLGVGMPFWKESWAFLISGKPKAVPLPAIPKITKGNSRFVFQGTLNSNHAVALVDSGCTSMIISADYVEKLGLEVETTEPCSFSFANKTTYRSCKLVRANFQCNGYDRAMEFYVAPVKANIILGTPWFESIVITRLDWKNRVVEFDESTSGQSYTWRGISKDKARVRSVVRSYFKNSQDLLRQSEWAAVVDIEEICGDGLECYNIEGEVSESPMYAYDNVSVNNLKAEKLIDAKRLSITLKKFQSVFESPTKLPPSRPDDHGITLIDDPKVPPWRPIPSLCQFELQALKEYLQSNLERNFIQHSKSPYGASVLFVKKKDGSLRLCVDYRGLNNVTVKDRTPMPNIKEMHDRLNGAKVFSKLDLRDGFNNILIKPEDTHKTAFRTRYGHFEFRVLPFGLCNAPATFCRMMNRIFGDLYDKCIIAYVDDILIYSGSVDEHLGHLEEVLARLQEHTLFVKESKCSFGVSATEFCGTGVNQSGISLDKSKLEPLFAHRQPKNVKDVQSFLGLCNWFRDFIPEFAETALALSELTKKGTQWSWNESHQSAVMTLLFRIVNAPCLKYFDDQLPTHVYTDASKFGIGGWIGQEHADGIHPVTFWSRKMTPQEVNYPTHERELLALVKMCAKYRHLLVGRPVVAHTDHAALIHINDQPNLSPRQIRWVESLQDFDIKIEYLPGKLNQLADVLSRNRDFAPVCGKCKKVTVEFDAVDYVEDEDVEHKLRVYFQNHKPAAAFSNDGKLGKNWSRKNNLYYYGEDRVYVPNVGDFRLSLLHDHHDIPTAGHQGFSRTLDNLKKNYYWETLREDTMKYVISCDSCQRNKQSNQSPAGLLHPLPIPEDRFETVSIDFMDLPVSKGGYDSAMIMVDKLTKLVTIAATKKSSTAEEAAELFLNRWFCAGRGLPKELISDRDTRFVSKFWQSLMQKLEVNLLMSTARHQQTNGQAEHGVKMVKDCLKAYVDYKGRNWDTMLPSVEYSLNNAVSSVTGYTPFQLAFGLDRTKKIKSPSTGVIQELGQNLEWARVQVAAQQDRMERSANRERSIPKKIVVGDRVLIERTGIKWPADSMNTPKLLPRRLGPFKVLNVDSELGNVEVELPFSLKIHNKFARDVVLLYKEPDEHFPNRHSPAAVQEPWDPETEFEVEKILDHRVFRGQRQLLIKWKDYSSVHNSWEPVKNIQADDVVQAYQQSRGVVALWAETADKSKPRVASRIKS